MSTTTITTIPMSLTSLIEDISPLSVDLYDSLRHLHSTLEVLHSYVSQHIDINPDPSEERIVDVLESTITIAASSRDHAERLDARLTKASNQLQQFPISRHTLFLGGIRESVFVNFLEQSHDGTNGWPRYGGPPALCTLTY